MDRLILVPEEFLAYLRGERDEFEALDDVVVLPEEETEFLNSLQEKTLMHSLIRIIRFYRCLCYATINGLIKALKKDKEDN